LLLEPQRSNLVLFSEQMNNAAWANTEDTTVSANAGVSPDGYTNADKLIPQATSNLHRISQIIAVTAATPYTYSVFVKKSGYDYFLIRVSDGSINNVGYDLVNGTVTFAASGYTGFIESYENDWFRLGFVRSFAGASANINMRPNNIIVNSNTVPAFTGDGTSGAFVWGAQLEAGAYATSYIPTLAASVTRVADAASKTGISALIGQTEGTIFIDFQYNQPSDGPNGRLLQVESSGGETAEAILPLILNNNQFQLTVWSSGVTQDVVAPSAGTVVPFGRQKFAVAYNAGVYSVYRNGSLFASGTGGTPSSLSVMVLGGSLNFARSISNPISQAILFTTRLSNAQLAELTSL
jgi:hypothetical protein